MTPLPPNSTKRYFLDYEHSGLGHTAMIRTSTGTTDGQAITRLDALLTSLGALVEVCTVIGLRVALAGSDITNAVTWTGAATFGTISASNVIRPSFVSWVGRSPGGRRTRITFYGCKEAQTDNWRLTTAEASEVGDVLTELRGSTLVYQAIDGGVPVWQSYANRGFNSYWQRKVRTL